MLGIFGMTLLGMVLWPATDPPDISGQWTSDEWGIVVLEAKGPGQYKGTFKDPVKGQSAEGESSGSGGVTPPSGSPSVLPGTEGLFGSGGVTTPSGSPSVLPGTDSLFGSIGVTTREGSR